MKSVPEIVIKSLHFELEETFHFILCNCLKGKKRSHGGEVIMPMNRK